MKKKSPPYAIIGAAVLGIIAVFIYLHHERAIRDQAAAALKAAQDKAAADLAAASRAPAPVVSEQPTHMRKVYYATQPIAPGVRISAAFFETKLTPDNVLPDAFTEGPDVDLVGWFATRNIEKGDPLTPRNVGKELPFMEGRISPGMRAIALPVFNADLNNTGGFVVDGDRVDLLMTRTSEDDKYEYDTQMFMQNLQVLYVPGPTIRTDKTQGVNPVATPGERISVVFEVTPEQAQALIGIVRAKTMKISMILRSRRDNTEPKIKPFMAADYFENPRRLQKLADTSAERVQELGKQIEAEEKKQGQGNTNETPTPPSP